MPINPEYLTPKELATITKTSVSFVLREAKKGRIPGTLILAQGPRKCLVRFDADSVRRWLESCKLRNMNALELKVKRR